MPAHPGRCRRPREVNPTGNNNSPAHAAHTGRRRGILLALLLAGGLFLGGGCARKAPSVYPLSAADSLKILQEIAEHRTALDSAFRLDPDSPFNRDTTIRYHGIRWFPPDLSFYFQSRLYRYRNPESVIVFGTKGEQRQMLKIGYFLLPYGGKESRLNVYTAAPSESERDASPENLLSVWFTDSTTGRETYHVGRYVDVGTEDPDPDHVYVIDLNDAYNPYCAYSSLYTCAIPRREDHLDFAVRAGEMNYSP